MKNGAKNREKIPFLLGFCPFFQGANSAVSSREGTNLKGWFMPLVFLFNSLSLGMLQDDCTWLHDSSWITEENHHLHWWILVNVVELCKPRRLTDGPLGKGKVIWTKPSSSGSMFNLPGCKQIASRLIQSIDFPRLPVKFSIYFPRAHRVASRDRKWEHMSSWSKPTNDMNHELLLG